MFRKKSSPKKEFSTTPEIMHNPDTGEPVLINTTMPPLFLGLNYICLVTQQESIWHRLLEMGVMYVQYHFNRRDNAEKMIEILQAGKKNKKKFLNLQVESSCDYTVTLSREQINLYWNDNTFEKLESFARASNTNKWNTEILRPLLAGLSPAQLSHVDKLVFIVNEDGELTERTVPVPLLLEAHPRENMATVAAMFRAGVRIKNPRLLMECLTILPQNDPNLFFCLTIVLQQHPAWIASKEAQLYIEKLRLVHDMYRTFIFFILNNCCQLTYLPDAIKNIIMYQYDDERYLSNTGMVFFKPATVDPVIIDLKKKLSAEAIKSPLNQFALNAKEDEINRILSLK